MDRIEKEVEKAKEILLEAEQNFDKALAKYVDHKLDQAVKKELIKEVDINARR